jgi:hypothetical protein
MSLIAELLENCPNDAERLILLSQLKKQIEVNEKPLKEKLLNTKLKHSQISYIERKDWVPSNEWKQVINTYDKEKKEALEESKKDPNGGQYKVSTYIKISEPKQVEAPVETKPGQDYSSFFHNQV